MNKTILLLIIGLAIGGGATWMLTRHHDEQAEEKKPAEEHKPESHVLKTNGHTYVKLDAKEQQAAGLKIAPLEFATLKPETKAFGRVLDAAPLAAVMVEISAARSALETSQKELARLKTLAADQNTSARALETAEAAVRRDQILHDAAQLKLMAGWGRAIAEQKDLPAFVHPLVTMESALVRLDLPLGDALAKPPTDARIAAFTAEDQPADAQLLGPVPGADPQSQSQGFLCLLKKSSLTPGTAVVGWLTGPGEEEKGVLVPRAAILRHEGEAFVYVQTGDELFERRELELHHPTEKGWFEDEGLKAGEKIVISGAQQLLSEELKGEGGEE